MPNQRQALVNDPTLGDRRGVNACHSKHLKKGQAYRESCRVCNPSYVKPVQLSVEEIHLPPLSKAQIPGPSNADTKKGDPFDKAKLWRLAERKHSLSEISSLFGLTQEQLREQIQEHFKMSWETLADRAPKELQNDLHDTVYRKARQGDVRFVLLLEKWGLLPSQTEQGRPLFQGIDNSDLSSVSTEELERRAAAYSTRIEMIKKVISRPKTFGTPGQITPTLELRVMTAGESSSIIQEPGQPLAQKSESVLQLGELAIQHVRTVEKVVEPTPKPAEVVQGPVTARPDSGLLVL